MRWRLGVVLVSLSVFGAISTAHADPPVVRSVEVRGEGERAEVVVRGVFAVPDYSVRTRDGGRTVIITVVGAALPEGGIQTVGSTSLIERTTASTNARGVRIEVGLSRAATHRARASSGHIRIDFEPVGNGDARSPAAGSTVHRQGEPVVRDVHIERRDGRDRVVVELDQATPFRVLPSVEGVARLEIRGATVGSGVSRELTGEPGSVIRNVRTQRRAGRTIVEVDRTEGATDTAIREGERIVWLFAAPRGPSTRGTRTINREGPLQIDTGDDGEMNTAEAAAFLSDVPLQVSAARGNRRYSGRRIDLDFKNADIHNILRLISDVGGVNVVTGDDVSGSVTIRMRNVPWDQALDVILQAKGLGMVRRGNLIRVAPLATLEKERESAIARQKQRVALAPLETRLVPVSYAGADALRPRIAELLSERGNVSVDERTNVLIVRDILENLDDVEELVRTLDTQTPQVLVEARIVEASNSYVRDVGIQWGGDVTLSSATGNPTGLEFPHNVGIAGGNFDTQSPTAGLSPLGGTIAAPNYAVNLPALVGTGAGGALGLAFGSVGGNVNLNVRLSALESNGLVRIVSSPRILTLDNHTANIAQGTMIPYSQISAQGVQTAFQEAKLELEVRPHVTSDGSVSMHVKVTRDEPDFLNTGPRGEPTILKREATTDLLVPDGHTAVIGGIYTRNTGRTMNQVPFFGDIPILGLLFQRRQVRDDRSELLIFLTPRIVNRAESLGR